METFSRIVYFGTLILAVAFGGFLAGYAAGRDATDTEDCVLVSTLHDYDPTDKWGIYIHNFVPEDDGAMYCSIGRVQGQGTFVISG